MQTTVDLPVAAASAPRNQQAVLYLEALQREQERYLDAIGCARSLLGEGTSQLAEMSAVQGRLVRRFFDAQRAILQQRARVDDGFRAFLAADVDAGRHERQLDALLDEWWQAERRDTAAALSVDEVTGPVPIVVADAAADDEFQSVIATFADDAVAPQRRLPASLVDALEAATPHGLDRLLDELVADLDAHLATAAVVSARSTSLPAPKPGDLVIVGSPDDDAVRFDTFWSQPTPGTDLAVLPDAEPARDWSWVPTQVVVPIVAVTAGLSIALLLIG
jgi:hypothetical protein